MPRARPTHQTLILAVGFLALTFIGIGWQKYAAPGAGGSPACVNEACVETGEFDYRLPALLVEAVAPGLAQVDVYLIYDFSCQHCRDNQDLLARVIQGTEATGQSLHTWRMAKNPAESQLGYALLSLAPPEAEVLRTRYFSWDHGVAHDFSDDADVLAWLMESGVGEDIARRALEGNAERPEARLVAWLESHGLIAGTPTLVVKGRVLKIGAFDSLDAYIEQARHLLE